MSLPTLEEAEQAFSNQDYFIGEGRHRSAYHIPGSRWVYKINRNGAGRVNRREYGHYNRIKASEIPDCVRLPEMHLLDGDIIAAEYIPGERPDYCDWRTHKDHHSPRACWRNIVDLIEDTYFLDDLCPANIRESYDDQVTLIVYIIDLGE